MGRRKENEHFSTIDCPLGTSVHRGSEPVQQTEKGEHILLLLLVRRRAAQPAPQVGGESTRIQAQTCLPPGPLFFPPHHTAPVEADAAEIKAIRWQASEISSSCSTGMSSVTTQSKPLGSAHRPRPHPTWLPGSLPQKGRAGEVPPHPAPASVG